eukprot:scaffold25422_cov187-Amphora_coffeaeformis.AAC.2
MYPSINQTISMDTSAAFSLEPESCHCLEKVLQSHFQRQERHWGPYHSTAFPWVNTYSTKSG